MAVNDSDNRDVCVFPEFLLIWCMHFLSGKPILSGYKFNTSESVKSSRFCI